MPLTMTLGNTLATSQVVNFAGYAGTDTIRVQYCARPDFEGAPVFEFDLAAVASTTIQQLNQYARYYIRARTISNAGVLGDWTATKVAFTPLSVARDLSPQSVMIAPARIVVPEPMVSIFSSFGSVAGFPHANMLVDGPQVWRAKTLDSYFQFTFEPGPTPIDTFAMLGTNLPESAQFKVVASNTLSDLDPGQTPAYEVALQAFRASANMPGRPSYHGVLTLPAPQRYRYWQMRIHAQCPGDTIQVQQFVAGLNRATKNYSVDKSETVLDFGSFDRSRAGQPERLIGIRGRQIDFSLSMLSEKQYEDVYATLGQRVGLTEPVLVIPNAKSGPMLHDRIAYGVLKSLRAVNNASPRFSLALSVESIF